LAAVSAKKYFAAALGDLLIIHAINTMAIPVDEGWLRISPPCCRNIDASMGE